MKRLLLKFVKALLGFVALAGITGGAALWIEHQRSTVLPMPSGPYGVGRRHIAWTDRAAPVGPDAAIGERAIWIWYPALERSGATQTSAYLPPELCAAVRQARGFLFGGLLTRDLAKVRAHAVDGAPFPAEPHSFPVLLLRGGASAEVWNYTTLAEDLASHGYVVVGFDVPYRTNVVLLANGAVARKTSANDVEAVAAPDRDPRVQRLLNAWTTDLSHMLDYLEQLNRAPDSPLQGRLNLQEVGAFGHSFGGTQAARLCEADPRCRAGVDLDGGLFGDTATMRINTPFLFLLSDHSGDPSAEGTAVRRDILTSFDRMPADGRALVTIKGANHFAFSDDTAMLKSHLLLGALRLFGIVRIEGRRQLEVTSATLRWFFDTRLRNRPTVKPSPVDYPELEFEK